MDFFKKGLEKAKQVASQVKEAVDERAGGDGLGGAGFTSATGSSGDVEFEAGVRHFISLNNGLKQIATKTQASIQAIRAHGQAGLSLVETLEAVCEQEFGEESHWSNSSMILRNVNQEVDAKFNGQMCSLLQRDILDKIAQELESNTDTKSMIDTRRANRETASREEADQAMDKLESIIRRRMMLVAHCTTILMSHQYNYYSRLSDRFQPMRQVVTDSKQLLAGGSSETASAASTTAPSPTPQPQAPSPSSVQAEPAAPKPTPTPEASPKKPEPAPLVEPTPTQPPPQPEPAKPSPPPEQPGGEVDLLGMLGGDPSPAPAPANNSAPAKKSPGMGPAATGDLLGDLFGGSTPQRVPSLGKQPSFKTRQPGQVTDDLLAGLGTQVPAEDKRRSKDTGDLLDFSSSAQASDPLADMFGSPPSSGRQQNKSDFMDSLLDGGGGGGAKSSAARVTGDDEQNKPIQRKAAPVGEQFKGSGDDREDLQRQFQAHVAAKAEAKAEEMRAIEEEKKAYEDAKFAAADDLERQIVAWAGPKHSRKNLRAMLASLDTVLWETAKKKWKPVGLHEVIMADQVKKVHRKAILVCHPDKVSNESTEVRLLAEQVHAVLHDALEKFRQTEPC